MTWTWKEGHEYVDLRRPKAILEGNVNDAYGHVRRDAPLVVCTIDGRMLTYGSVEEMMDDGWELA